MLRFHLHEHLQFTESNTEVAFCLLKVGQKIVALAVVYVDYELLAFNPAVFDEFNSFSKYRFYVKFDTFYKLPYLG